MDENRNSMLKRPQCFSSGPKWKKVGKHENRPPRLFIYFLIVSCGNKPNSFAFINASVLEPTPSFEKILVK